MELVESLNGIAIDAMKSAGWNHRRSPLDGAAAPALRSRTSTPTNWEGTF